MDSLLDILTYAAYIGEAVLVLSSIALGIGARAPLGAVSFWAAQNLAAIAMVIGWVLLLPWSLAGAWTLRGTTQYDGTVRVVALWNSAWLDAVWGNAEDGVAGPGWYLQGKAPWLRTYLWSAWRNSANNLRFILRWYGAEGAPFYRYVTPNGRWYFQAGWFADNGFPVLSAGRV